MEILNALEFWGSLPLDGGYLNQPITLMRDVQVIRDIMKSRREEAASVMESVRAASQHAKSDVPLPPVPEELLYANR